MILDRELLAEAIGHEPRGWTPVNTGGYTRSQTWRVPTRDGIAFVKQADEEGGLHMLRREAIVYRNVSGAFLPAFVGFADSGERALLAIEFLEEVDWPPPYPPDPTRLFDAIHAVGESDPPAELPRHGPWRPRWPSVVEDPGPFLELGVCSRAWFDSAIEALADAEREARFEGDALVHNDVYSGNVGFAPRGAVLVDWGAAVCGSSSIDVAFAQLSVRVERGSPPPADGALAPIVAAIAGHFAVEAHAPLPEWADPSSTLRADMKGDLGGALEWLAELLDLPPLS